MSPNIVQISVPSLGECRGRWLKVPMAGRVPVWLMALFVSVTFMDKEDCAFRLVQARVGHPLLGGWSACCVQSQLCLASLVGPGP